MQSPNNDFSDWVGQDKGFIAVNANYRLGLCVSVPHDVRALS